MNKHVVSKIICERLKALGVKQESQFYWVFECKKWSIKKFKGNDGKEWAEDFPNRVYSAFLASELAEMMKSKGMGVVAYSSIQGKWWCSGGKWDAGKQAYDGLEQSDTMQDALALMLEYLIQNKMITI